MEIKVTSREIIKPSKPTPPENKTYHLCSFDIFHPNTYFPLILFYPTFTNPNDLKRSLSETLTIFYPLAGRRNDLFSVSCNDEGAVYYEATVNTSISDFLNPPKLESLDQLLPCEPYKTHPPAGGESPLPHLLVQVNTFECGGVAIGLCNLHTIMDSWSCRVLLTTWSAICRDKRDEIVSPDFDSSFALYPPRDISRVRAGLVSSSDKIETNCTVGRFVFTEEAINELRSKAKDEDDDGASNKPTRYQAVSSFMSKHMIHAYRSKGMRSSVLLMHILDVRRRRGDPLTSNSMGNLVWPVMIPYDDDVNDGEDSNNICLNALVKITRQNIERFDRNFFLRVERDPKFLLSDECAGMLMEGIEKKKPISLVFSSWCNFGFSEMDFGCGKPLWVGFRGGTQETAPNNVILIDTSQGIEVWITMPQEFLAVLEKDEEFLRYALLNPTVPC